MASSDPNIRASDDDRETTAAELRDHYAAGRLTSDEFNERLDKAYTAKTVGDLAELKTDLPAPKYDVPAPASPGQLPQPSQPAGPIAVGSDRYFPACRVALGSWLSVSLVAFVIWLLSGANDNFWFLWPTGVFGALTLARWVRGIPGPTDGRAVRRQYRHDYRRYRRGF